MFLENFSTFLLALFLSCLANRSSKWTNPLGQELWSLMYSRMDQPLMFLTGPSLVVRPKSVH